MADSTIVNSLRNIKTNQVKLYNALAEQNDKIETLTETLERYMVWMGQELTRINGGDYER